MKFTELKLDERLIEAISYMGFETATPIQEKAIPSIVSNKDLIACAQTGTGKTAAFILPVLHKLATANNNSINTLILVPTRELAMQIDQQIQALSYFVPVSSIAVYGGGSGIDWAEQKKALTEGADIIVATPGKLISHLEMKYVKLEKLQHFIMDEADRMLDMGFIDDIQRINKYLPEKKQTLMFSATMPKSIEQLAQKMLTNPDKIALSISKPAAGVSQKIYMAHDAQKDQLLVHLLKERPDYDSVIIFSSTKDKISTIVRLLNKNNLPSKGISSNFDQDQREEVLRGFKSKRIRILVATDVMSRGIDVKEINMVINYDVPNDAEDYVHRVGRTARANTTGEAITLVNVKDMHKLRKIERLIETELTKLQPPEEFGEGPVYRADKPKFKHNNGGGKKKFNPNKKRKFYKPKSKNKND